MMLAVFMGVILSNDPLILTSDVLLTQTWSVESVRLLVNKLSSFVVWTLSVSRSLVSRITRPSCLLVVMMSF